MRQASGTDAVWQRAMTVVALLAVGCSPSLNSPNSQERLRAMNQLADPAALAEVVRREQDPAVRNAALGKIADQKILASLAMSDQDGPIARDATKQLTDQAALGTIALESKDDLVRSIAVKKLGNQTVLARIAVKDPDWRVRMEAVERLTDQAMLARIAMEDGKAPVRLKAVENKHLDITGSGRLSVFGRRPIPLAFTAHGDDGNILVYQCPAVLERIQRLVCLAILWPPSPGGFVNDLEIVDASSAGHRILL